MYDRRRDNPVEYTDEQARRHQVWLAEGDGPGHYRRRCEACAEVFYSVHRDARYCDRRCYEWGYRNPPKDCPRCGRTFRNARRKWCSATCKVAAAKARGPVGGPTKKHEADQQRPVGRIMVELL